MADFTNLSVGVLYDLLVNTIRDCFNSVATMFDGTSDVGLPDKAKRYNSSTNQWEIYSSGTWSVLGFHAALTAQIAAAVAAAVEPIGSIKAWPTATAPAKYFICDGSAKSRTTYAALFAVLGTTWGTGDGSTTFNIPDGRGRTFVGKATSGSFATAEGTVGGTLALSFTVPNHAHGIDAHSHGYAHTHGTPDHAHTVASHTHTVPAHGHAVANGVCTILINASGFHAHPITGKATAVDGDGKNTGSDIFDFAKARSGTPSGVTTSPGVSLTQAHTHANSTFQGTVGYWDGGSTGLSGDNVMNTGTASPSTNTSGGGTTTSQSVSTTDNNAAALTTHTDGTCSTDTKATAYFCGNWIIRYQ